MYLENPDRIKKVAQDIAAHFKENLDGRFKAMVVAVNRLSCVRYKRELDRLLPKEYSEVVMTYNPLKDQKEIQDYFKETIQQNHGKEIEDIRKETVTKFKEEQNPRILIVTDMLLTGFDAPILQTMYLDKPLKGTPASASHSQNQPPLQRPQRSRPNHRLRRHPKRIHPGIRKLHQRRHNRHTHQHR